MQAALNKGLVVLLENILGGFAVQAFSGLKHGLGQLVHIHLGNGGQILCGTDVQGRAGWGLEFQRVGQNGGQQKSCNVLGHILIGLLIHLINHRCGTAHRLITEIDRAAGFQIADAVVIDDFENLRFLPAVYTLGALVVIHQNQLPSMEV